MAVQGLTIALQGLTPCNDRQTDNRPVPGPPLGLRALLPGVACLGAACQLAQTSPELAGVAAPLPPAAGSWYNCHHNTIITTTNNKINANNK